MQRFEFNLLVELDASRHTAKQLQEALNDAIENVTIENEKLMSRIRGMTVHVSTIRQVKEVPDD